MAEPTYRIESVANACHAVCSCGRQSSFVPSETSAMKALREHWLAASHTPVVEDGSNGPRA